MKEFFDECMTFFSRQPGVYTAILISLPFVQGLIVYFGILYFDSLRAPEHSPKEKMRDKELPSTLPSLEPEENILPNKEQKVVRPTIVVGRNPAPTWSLF